MEENKKAKEHREMKQRISDKLNDLLYEKYPYLKEYEAQLLKFLHEFRKEYLHKFKMDKLGIKKIVSNNRKNFAHLKKIKDHPEKIMQIKFVGRAIQEDVIIDTDHAIRIIMMAISKDEQCNQYFDNSHLGHLKGAPSLYVLEEVKKASQSIMKFIGNSDDLKSENQKHLFIASLLNIIRDEYGEEELSEQYIAGLLKKKS